MNTFLSACKHSAWPPHQHIIIEALRNLPQKITSTPLTPLHSNVSSFSLVPPGQLGLVESDLPIQPISSNLNASSTGPAADINEIESVALNGSTTITVTNGGPAIPGEGWAATLAREMANRYISSVFCSWYATGGSIPGLLPRLPDSVLNLTFSVNNTGRMFEKVSMLDIDVAGSGGEYVGKLKLLAVLRKCLFIASHLVRSSSWIRMDKWCGIMDSSELWVGTSHAKLPSHPKWRSFHSCIV